MKKVFASGLAGVFLIVSASGVAANTVSPGAEGGKGELYGEGIMEIYQNTPPKQMPKHFPELIAWLAGALLEKGIEWVRKKADQEKVQDACSCYGDWQDEGNQDIKGIPGHKNFGVSYSPTDYDDDDDEYHLTEEEISALDNFCF